jgi:hypothetical protein
MNKRKNISGKGQEKRLPTFFLQENQTISTTFVSIYTRFIRVYNLCISIDVKKTCLSFNSNKKNTNYSVQRQMLRSFGYSL